MTNFDEICMHTKSHWNYLEIFKKEKFYCQNFLMSHFLQAVFLSAWPWQIYLCAPCFLSLHSHSMTNVKRISSLHENSHSTRTKRVNRMAVIQTVSKLTDTHVPQSQSRSHVELTGGFTGVFQGHRLYKGLSCFLSSWSIPVIFVLFCSAGSQSEVSWLGCWTVSRREVK